MPVDARVRLLGEVLNGQESRVKSREPEGNTTSNILALDSRLLALDLHVLGVCRIRTRPREGRRPGSIPGEDTYLTLEPDGTAAACKAA